MSEMDWDKMRARHDARTGRSPMGNESLAYHTEFRVQQDIIDAGKTHAAWSAAPAYPSAAGGGTAPRAPTAPLTLAAMSKGGAWLAGGLAAVVLWVYSGMNLGQGVVYAAAAAVAGALAGAALYVALRVLAVVLRVAAGVLAIGVVLHLLGVLNLFQVLGRWGRALGL